VTERSIIFQGSMIRAIRAGRKTRTSRVIKPQPADMDSYVIQLADGVRFATEDKCRRCPYGVAGDVLRVRETWRRAKPELPDGVEYKADNSIVYSARDSAAAYAAYTALLNSNLPRDGKWRSPLFMPKWTSRERILITNVTVERIQEITEEEARAEGVKSVLGFSELWDAINAAPKPDSARGAVAGYKSYPWDAGHCMSAHRGLPWKINGNPFVWIVDFERIKCQKQ